MEDESAETWLKIIYDKNEKIFNLANDNTLMTKFIHSKGLKEEFVAFLVANKMEA